ncbi:MAG TPA: hypothetical protein VND45_01170 [Thermoanaerobaculia bacterium]|jgi:hypothetical protein|nr:hypothetical protein [Thermoanaerobaculia bacterium]
MRKLLVPSLLLLVACSAYANKPRAFNGEAVVRNIGNNRVVVLLDTNSDQNVDQGFLLSSDLPVSSTGARCPGARVEFTEGYVRVKYDTKVWDLYVAGYPEPPVLQMDTTKFIGYALVHSSGDSGCTVERAMKDAGACYGYGKD